VIRPRRLRKTEWVRELVAESQLGVKQLVQPFFLAQDPRAEEPIAGFEGVSRWGIERLLGQVERALTLGIHQVLLFGSAPEHAKDAEAASGLTRESTIVQAISRLKETFKEHVVLMSDVCLCPYTNHGHCGILESGEVENDRSLGLLAKMAVLHAQAGSDFVAPSDMMDGRIGAIRQALDEHQLTNTGVLAYTAKYASSYYGPFRNALDSSPKGMDRATYQMDYRNKTEALRELSLDLAEGADLVMVKPALAYLDIIQDLKAISTVPVVAYSVSGEYQMVKLMAKTGLVDAAKMTIENLMAIRRAGADVIVTYSAMEAAQGKWL